MRGDEIDAGAGIAAIGLIQIGTAGETKGKVGQPARFAVPEITHRVPIATIPFRPQQWKTTHLITAVAHVPRLGNQFHIRQHRVLVDDVEKGGQPVDGVQLPRQRRGQIETKAVDVHLQHPVAQTVHDQLKHLRVTDVERIAAAGEIHVVTGIVFNQPVISGIVHPAQTQSRPHLAALAGVVVDHVQDHLDAGLVQQLDHALEFAYLFAVAAAGAVAEIRRKVIQRIVTPVVAQTFAVQMAGMRQIMVNRHQLDGGHVQ